MRFSEAFGITKDENDDWFDPHLSVDTRLFVDPLLIYLTDKPNWTDAHDELLAHFVHCYRLVAQSTGPQSTSARAARRLLTFPEPEECCLGFTASGTRGSGTGSQFAGRMADGIAVALAAGLDNPEHIEEIGILNMGIGADRISDAVCNVLKRRLISYTRTIATRHSVPMERHRVENSRCVVEQARWLTETIKLPTNPHNGKPILLVPEEFLNDLPTLNPEDWFNANLNDDLRIQLNLAVGQRVRKEDIVELARSHPERVRRWAREQVSRPDIQGYDFQEDRRGVVQWDAPTREFADNNPIELAVPSNPSELRTLIDKVLDQFRHFIETQRGWELLWNSDGTEKNEEAAQLLFLGVAQNYLRVFDVEVDREVELGRGPVDFKCSRGSTLRMLLEVKKAHNGRFWKGLENQLPSYLVSDDANEGWFVAIRYRNNQASQRRMNELPSRVSRVAAATGKSINYKAIDGRARPTSASRL